MTKISEYLNNFWNASDNLWNVINDQAICGQFILEGVSEKDCEFLNKLVMTTNFRPLVFYILLKVKPELAINTLFSSFLNIDISNSQLRIEADLDFMFVYIKEILGEDKLQEILNSPEFLPKNKRNPRIKKAIAFALDKD